MENEKAARPYFRQMQEKHIVFHRKCRSRCFYSIGLSTWEGLSDNGDKNKNSKNLNSVKY